MAFHLSSALRSPRAYVAFQQLVGGARLRVEAFRWAGLSAGERVLDLGCGPAYYLHKLPAVEYWGFDTNSTYISWARNRWKDRGTFFDVPFGEEQLRQHAKFDAILLMGLLHHIDDDAGLALLDLVRRALAPQGRVVLLDTVLYSGQPALTRFFSKNDRGDFVRTPEHYQRLGARSFEDVSGRIVGGLPFPSECYLMMLRRPRC
jgi:SAM-dependent methyltransferase